MRRLAFFWLLCAATGFAAAAGMALLLSVAIDGRPTLPGPTPPPLAGLFERLHHHRPGTWDAEIGE